MKRRRNHLLAWIPTEELIEEIIHRHTFLGVIIVNKEDHEPKCVLDNTKVEEKEFIIHSLLDDNDKIKILDKANSQLKEKK